MENIKNLLENLLAAYKVANDYGFESNLNRNSDLDDLREEVLNFMQAQIEKEDYIQVDADSEGSSSNIVFTLPLAGSTEVDGEFAYDKETGQFSHEAQDEDGNMYVVKWKN